MEYTGPIEIKVDEAKGRGVYATRDIEVGEMILVEKAFAVNRIREARE